MFYEICVFLCWHENRLVVLGISLIQKLYQVKKSSNIKGVRGRGGGGQVGASEASAKMRFFTKMPYDFLPNTLMRFFLYHHPHLL